MSQRLQRLTAIIIVAGLQTLALGYMVWERASLIAGGKEVTLEVAPVDPRSLFRGDYVILNYRSISQLDATILTGPPQKDQPLYVTLRRTPSGAWMPVSAAHARPDRFPEGDVVIQGRIDDIWQPTLGQPTQLRVRYGIESYFVPEGTGRDLENRVRDGSMKVIVAVGASGDSAIKGLEIEGVRIYDEPLL